ncbi:MAG TPA: hypothetical protein PK020_02745 [Ilumatobacteraceae bacterium]|nr:hypothetical protein [Ilumatobacteraceae bacterium]HRB02110.1 hypothetical protein [Ilumatobacteraceae bacterium]
MTNRRRVSLLFCCVGLALAGCGGRAPASERSIVEVNSDETTPSGVSTPADTEAPIPTSPDDLMPTADPSTYIGSNQVVHLAVLPDGTTPTLDIWAMRSFQYAPILLVEGLQYGEVSPTFGAPEGMSVIAVESGAGPDAEPFTSVFSARDGQAYTDIIVFDSESSAGAGLLLYDTDPGNSQAFPEALDGQALVQLYAYQLRINPLAVGTSFDQRIAGVDTAYNVGIEGITGCAPQPRFTDQGFSPSVLGGTTYIPFDLAPGATTFTFHGWGSTNDDCSDPSVIDPVTVNVTAGERAWVLLHSRDGKKIEALVVPAA